MRLVLQLSDSQKAEKFALYLRENQITGQLEMKPEGAEIWVLDEDDIEKAQEAFKTFEALPSWEPSQETLTAQQLEEAQKENPELAYEESEMLFESQEPEESSSSSQEELERPKEEKPFFGKLTISVTLSCIILFIWAVYTSPPKMNYPGLRSSIEMMVSAPYSKLVYEDPLAFQHLYEFSKDYEAAKDKAAFMKTNTAFQMLYRYQTTPYWHGFYETYLVPNQTYSSLNKAFTPRPTFEQIGQGEVWRIFTPALLHAGLFHILFNLLWFVFLGRQIESRIGFWKFLILIAFIAAVSNTAQYLMSGPAFLGLSGVVLGLAGFIYMRQAKAAWEGYSIQRATLYFLGIYVVALLVLQLVSFVLEYKGYASIAPNIANTAHLVGALCGLGLGSINFFSAWNLSKLNK